MLIHFAICQTRHTISASNYILYDPRALPDIQGSHHAYVNPIYPQPFSRRGPRQHGCWPAAVCAEKLGAIGNLRH